MVDTADTPTHIEPRDPTAAAVVDDSLPSNTVGAVQGAGNDQDDGNDNDNEETNDDKNNANVQTQTSQSQSDNNNAASHQHNNNNPNPNPNNDHLPNEFEPTTAAHTHSVVALTAADAPPPALLPAALPPADARAMAAAHARTLARTGLARARDARQQVCTALEVLEAEYRVRRAALLEQLVWRAFNDFI